MESHTCDIASVSFERQDSSRVRRLDVVKLDCMVPGSSEIAFVWRNTKAIDLRIRMWDCSRADSGKCFPESNGVVVTSL